MIKFLTLALVVSTAILLVVSQKAVRAYKESKEYKAKVDSLEHKVDSLNYELFPIQTELTRYQIAYEIFTERNPKAASEYGDIISNETE